MHGLVYITLDMRHPSVNLAVGAEYCYNYLPYTIGGRVGVEPRTSKSITRCPFTVELLASTAQGSSSRKLASRYQGPGT